MPRGSGLLSWGLSLGKAEQVNLGSKNCHWGRVAVPVLTTTRQKADSLRQCLRHLSEGPFQRALFLRRPPEGLDANFDNSWPF